MNEGENVSNLNEGNDEFNEKSVVERAWFASGLNPDGSSLDTVIELGRLEDILKSDGNVEDTAIPEGNAPSNEYVGNVREPIEKSLGKVDSTTNDVGKDFVRLNSDGKLLVIFIPVGKEEENENVGNVSLKLKEDGNDFVIENDGIEEGDENTDGKLIPDISKSEGREVFIAKDEGTVSEKEKLGVDNEATASW